MCDECRKFAEGMLKSATRPSVSQEGPGWRAPSAIIPKFKFALAHLPHDMTFSHACGRKPEEVKASNGFDPAFAREICYSGDTGEHEHWFDRMTFAAVANENRQMSKVAAMQGYGTDEKGMGDQYVYEFKAPRGTLVRSTNGAFAGEVCFPEPIPYSWITKIQQVTVVKGVKTFVPQSL
jgi:hypothetical protein